MTFTNNSIKAGNTGGIVNKWYDTVEIDKDVYLIDEPKHVRCFLINGDDKSILIDTGAGLGDIKNAIKHLLHDDIMVLNTHWHFDHIGGNRLFDQTGISSKEKDLASKEIPNSALRNIYIGYMHEFGIAFPKDFSPSEYRVLGKKPDFIINEGDIYPAGDHRLEAIATPGHTQGSMSFLDHKTGILFCGDFIFNGPLYIQYAESRLDDYLISFEKLSKRLDEIKAIYPCHGDYPVPVNYFNQVYSALQKVKAGGLEYVEEESSGFITLRYKVDDVIIYLSKPDTEPQDFRKLAR